MSPAEGLEAILEAAGIINGATDWSSRFGLDETPKSVAFIDTGGRGGEVKVAIDYPTVQIIVQGSATQGGYSAAYAKAREIHDHLQAIPTPNVTYTELVSCVSLNQPIWLGKGDRDQSRWSLNFRLITEPSNVGNRTY